MTFDATISLGNVLQLLTLIIGFTAAWVKLSTRLTAIELEQQHAKTAREAVALQLSELSRQVARLEGQLGAGQRRRIDPRE